jgi:hypothetical protein
MKDNTIIIVLLTILFIVELTNQFWMIRLDNRIMKLDQKSTEFFEPILPQWEEGVK